MPSEAEYFLGIKEPPEPRQPIPKSILRMRFIWVLTLIISYCLSVLWLTGAVVCVPYVIWMAPLGFTSLFNPPINHADARVAVGLPECLVHLIFWALFLTGLIGCKSMSRWMLRSIFITVSIILILTMYGCSQYYYMNTGDIN